MNTQAENELAKAYELLKKGQLAKASEILSEALTDDLESIEILYTGITSIPAASVLVPSFISEP